MSHLRERPTLVYDGDCGFCTATVNALRARVDPDAVIVPYQYADLAALGVTAERARREMLWIDLEGRVFGGAQAFAVLLVHQGGPWRVPGLALRLPPARWAAQAVYRAVAAQRHRLPGGTPACDPRRPAA